MEEITNGSDHEDSEIPYKRYQDLPSSQDSDRTVDYELSQKSEKSDSQEIVCLDDTKKETMKDKNNTAEPELIDLTEDEDENDDSFNASEKDVETSNGNEQDNPTVAVATNSEDRGDKAGNIKPKERNQGEKSTSDKNNEIIILDDFSIHLV